MKYRKLDPAGDYTFGRGPADFYEDSAEVVAQAVKTRLLLIRGEWFLDSSAGVPYKTEFLGVGTIGRYDFSAQQVILSTPGVTKLVDYASKIDSAKRAVYISATIDTQYGTISVQTTL